MAKESPAVKQEVQPKPSTPKSWEEAVASLKANPKVDNPYEKSPGEETTEQRKIRLRNAHRFESERSKLEDQDRKAKGGGAYGRVHSVVDAWKEMAPKVGDNPFKLEDVVKVAEKHFVAFYPDKKKSAGSSELYSRELLLGFLLAGFLSYNPESETYRFSPELRKNLQTPTSK